ncbi:MAG: hypothetical protein RL511_1775 [Bacteroidota bacterium]|jgi:hypothetical protein
MKQEKKSKEAFVNPIDPDKIAENPHLLPYAHTVGGAVIKPEDTGKLKGRALSAMNQQTDMQLSQIYEQMQLLAAQAQKIQARKTISDYIYQTELRFEPLINHVYHLYRKQDQKLMLSLIGPLSWGKSGDKLTYLASVKLLADHTWEVLEQAPDFDFNG